MTPHPTLESHYVLCSDRQWQSLQLPFGAAVDQGFLTAVGQAHEKGLLQDCGHLVLVRSTFKLAFLVTQPLPKGMQLAPDAQARFLREHGVALRLFSHRGPGRQAGDSDLLATVQLDRPQQFAGAVALSHALAGLCQPVAAV